MPAILIFPAGTYLLLLIIFVRAFTRSTGLNMRILPFMVYVLCGAAAIFLTYVILVSMSSLTPMSALPGGNLLSPLIEEILKYVLLYLLYRRLFIAGEPLQTFRQTILAAVIMGLSYGLIETYLYLFSNISRLTNTMLIGSIPLHLSTTGLIGAVIAGNHSLRRRVVFMVIIIASHLAYNQVVQLAPPVSYLSFLMLLIAVVLLLNILTSPRDFTNDE